MHPMRKLLYHRGVDDHIGTYVTDYIFSGVCFILCLQLLVRICRERRLMTSEQRMTSSCLSFPNCLPWNWPKEKPTVINMTSYAIILFGFCNFAMMMLGGLTHQFLQTVEPYNDDVNNLWDWLIIWRIGSSFSALVCFSLLIMAEQLITQEEIIRIPHTLRIVYYIIITSSTLCFFGINYLPLTGRIQDPFSIRQSFTVTFGVVFIYGICTLTVVIHHSCYKYRRSCNNSTDNSPSHSVQSTNPKETKPIKSICLCLSLSSKRRHDDNDERISLRRWELLVMTSAPWIFVVAGAMNHFLKSKCADSDSAQSELGCPLPDSFNHNALMHVIQIASAILFFIGENMAITRRKYENDFTIQRAATSSTIYNDVINSCEVTNDKSQYSFEENINNNNRSDDVIRVQRTSLNTDDVISSQSTETDEVSESLPKFPTFVNYETAFVDNRYSTYDNISHA